MRAGALTTVLFVLLTGVFAQFGYLAMAMSCAVVAVMTFMAIPLLADLDSETANNKEKPNG